MSESIRAHKIRTNKVYIRDGSKAMNKDELKQQQQQQQLRQHFHISTKYGARLVFTPSRRRLYFVNFWAKTEHMSREVDP